jgi:hypothetical protein
MDSTEAKETFVLPFYLELIGGWNYNADDPRGNELIAHMRRTVKVVSDHDAVALWNTGWREAAMASWWACMHDWEGSEGHIGRTLSPSFPWAGNDGLVHFVALARLGSTWAAEVVIECMERPNDPTFEYAAVAGRAMYPVAASAYYKEKLSEAELIPIAHDAELNGRFKRLLRLSAEVAG